MEVILLEDVKALGKKGQIVKVNDGYARNFILKKNLGVEANGQNLNNLKLQKANEEKIAKEKLDEAKKLAAELSEKYVTLSIRSGEGGRTFGSVSTKEISEAVKKQLGYDLDKKKMLLDEPIRTLGTHIIHLKLHKDVVGKLEVRVTEAK